MRRSRPLVAWFALFAIVFAQLATAAYACTLVAPVAPAPGCAEMGMAADQERPMLCLEHCKGDVQLFDHHSPVEVGAGPVVAPIVVVFVADELRAAPAARWVLDPRPPLPVFAASARLRI